MFDFLSKGLFLCLKKYAVALLISFYFPVSQLIAQDGYMIFSGHAEEVPIHFKSGGDHFDGHPYVTCRIDTTELELFLDTGAPWATIHLSPEALEKENVEFTGKTQKNQDAWGNTYKSRQYKIPEIQFGGLTVKDVVGVEHKFGEKTDGLFSFKLFENYNLLIDFPGKRIGSSK